MLFSKKMDSIHILYWEILGSSFRSPVLFPVAATTQAPLLISDGVNTMTGRMSKVFSSRFVS
jgi:hypothetical protein